MSGYGISSTEANIVECTDGEFHQPEQVYFPRKEVRAVFEDFVHYAYLTKKSEGRKNLYRWLGVANRPRPYDVLRFIDKLMNKPPNQSSIQIIRRVLEAMGNAWDRIPEDEKQSYDSLKNRKWLLAEESIKKWYYPHQLHAAYNKSLFKSQAKFIDLSLPIQRKIRDFLEYLGVNLRPQSLQVVQHLLKCSKLDREPPKGIYQWLNNSEQSQDIYKLRNFACLRIQGKYLRPDQVFWGQHYFGRFRVQLGTDFLSYQNLLQTLGIKESPDYSDAFEVLKDISTEIGNNRLKPEDKAVVTHCWIMLTEALQSEQLDSASIETELHSIQCVPNLDNILYLPSRIFFEDRPRLADKFSKPLEKHTIPRKEGILQALEAAGVRPISDIVRGFINESVNSQEDKMLKARVIERADLIRTISNDTVQLDSIRFLRTNQLKVKWSLKDFIHDWPPTSPEPVEAHLDGDEQAIYFVLRNGNIRPWPAIARELTQLIAPRKEIGAISPGLKIVLEASTYEDAVEQLNDLGIALTEELRNLAKTGRVAKTFDEKPSSENQESSDSSQNGVMSSGGIEKTHQNELKDEDDVSGHTFDTTSNPTISDSSGTEYSTENNSEKSDGIDRNGHTKGGQEEKTEDDVKDGKTTMTRDPKSGQISDNVKDQNNSNGTSQKESNRSNGLNRPRPETGRPAEDWLEKRLEKVFPNCVQRHIRDKANRESDFVVSAGSRKFHIEVKHVANWPGTFYWSELECEKAQILERSNDKYIMAILSPNGERDYQIRWLWHPLNELKRASREVQWTGRSDYEAVTIDSWDVETRRPNEVPTKRHQFRIKPNDKVIKDFEEDTEDLEVLCRKIDSLNSEIGIES